MARLVERHGDARLTDLLLTLADCQKARSASIHDRCVGDSRQREHMAKLLSFEALNFPSSTDTSVSRASDGAAPRMGGEWLTYRESEASSKR